MRNRRSPHPRRVLALTLGAAVAALAFTVLPAHPASAQDDVDPVDPIEDAALREEAAAKFDEALQTFQKAFDAAVRQAAAGGEAREKNLARAELYLEKLESLAETVTKQGETATALAGYDDAQLGALLKGHVDFHRARFLLAEGDTEGAGKLAAGLGLVTDWFVVGPFDNERGQGFRSALPPEAAIDLDAVLKGKDQHEVTWRRVPVKEALGFVDLDALMRPNDQALAFAAALVKSETEQDVALRLGSDEAVKAWVNGALVIERDLRRSMAFDQDAAAVRLRAGWNVVLLKVCDQTGAWGFRARLTTPAGGPAKGITFATTTDEAKAALAATAGAKALTTEAVAETGARTWYDRQTARENKRARDLFHLGFLHHTRKYDAKADRKAENLLQAAAEAEPTNAVYRFHYAEAAAPEIEMDVEKEENRQRAGREKALELDPAYAVAYRALADYYTHSLVNLTRAEQLLRKALEVNPAYLEARLDLSNVLRQRGLPGQAEMELRKVLADPRAASNETIARARASDADDRGLGRRAADAWKEVLRLDARGNDVRARVAELAVSAMAPDEALALLDAVRAVDPFDTDVLVRRAEILEGRSDFEGAKDAIRKALEIVPLDDALLARLGELELRTGARDAAIANFRRSLELDPKNQRLERYVEFLDPEAAPFEDDFQVDVGPLLEKAAGWKNAENDGWLVVLDQSVVKANRDGTHSRFARSVVRILTDAGVQTFNQVYASGWGARKWKWARVTKADGSVVDAKIQGFQADMPTLAAGDVVDYAYRVDEREQSFFGDYFDDRFFFADRVPVLLSQYTLLTPTDRTFYFHQKNFDVKPEITTRDDGKTEVRTWRATDLAKIRDEVAMPDMREAAPQVQVTTYKDWDSFARWWYALIRDQRIMTDEMKAKVAELVKGKETRLDKVRAIYEYVTGEITYQAWEFGVHGYKPYTTSSIFEKKEGDCKDKALLLCAFYGEIGIEAYPVLIYADQGRPKDDLTLAMVGHFNHCIAWVPDVDGKGTPMFLDGTAQYHSMDAPPAMDRGATVLIVKPEGAQLLTIDEGSPEHFGIDQEWKVEVRDDGTAHCEGTFTWRGDLATQARQIFSVDGQRPLILQGMLSRSFGPIKSLKHTFADLKDLSRPQATYTVSFDATRFAKKQGESHVLPTAFFDALGASALQPLFARPEREHDMVLPFPPAVMRTKATYTLPEGWTVEASPPTESVDGVIGTFSLASGTEGRTLSYSRTMEVRKTRLAKEDYGRFRDAMTKAVQLSGQTFKVKRGAAPAPTPTPETPAPATPEPGSGGK